MPVSGLVRCSLHPAPEAGRVVGARTGRPPRRPAPGARPASRPLAHPSRPACASHGLAVARALPLPCPCVSVLSSGARTQRLLQDSSPLRPQDKGGLWLFDLNSDPNEETNVAAARPDIVQRMRARLAALADRKNGYRDPQFNIPNPRAFPGLHNGTWSPFRELGEELAPLATDYVINVTASLATGYWD